MSNSNDTNGCGRVEPRPWPWKGIAGIAGAFIVGVAIGATDESEP